MNSETGDRYESPFSSHDCIDVIIDGPEDTTVRPLTGERLKNAMAERDKIAYWEAVRRGEITPKGESAEHGQA
jgi:hypothetical protein